MDKVNEIKEAKEMKEKVALEDELRELARENNLILKEAIICSLILSKCDFVLKTHSQLSAYSKVFNPNLQIYRVNGCLNCYWPESFIPMYSELHIKDPILKILSQKKERIEYSKEKKLRFKMWR